MAHRGKEKKEAENLWMMVRTWTNWNLVRELLWTSWPLGGSSGSRYRAAIEVRGKKRTTCTKTLKAQSRRKEGKVIHR
jgi:hypothetical protein